MKAFKATGLYQRPHKDSLQYWRLSHRRVTFQVVALDAEDALEKAKKQADCLLAPKEWVSGVSIEEKQNGK